MLKIVQQVTKQIKMKVIANFRDPHSSTGSMPLLMGFAPDPRCIYTRSVQLSKGQIRQVIWFCKIHSLSCELGHWSWLDLLGKGGGRGGFHLCKSMRKSRHSLENFSGIGAAISAGRFAGSHLSPSFWALLLLSEAFTPTAHGLRAQQQQH